MRTNSPSKISELSNPKILLPAARSGGQEFGYPLATVTSVSTPT